MDIEYLLFLQIFREMTDNIFTPFMLFITTLGEKEVLYPLLAITYWCINKRTGTLMLMSFSFASFVNQFLKITFTVYRPWILSPLIEPNPIAKIGATGYSFPSGHVANSTGVYGALAFSVKNKFLQVLLALLVLMILFSRNYLGVHTPQDVLASLTVTLLLVFFADRLINWIDAGENRDLLLVLAGIILGIALTIYASVKSYPIDYVDGKLLADPKVMTRGTFRYAGTMFGFWLGWFIDRRYINYQLNFDSTLQRVFVGSCGFLCLMPLVHFLAKTLNKLLGRFWGGFSSNLLIMIFIIVIYPWLVSIILNKFSNPGKIKS